MVYVHVFASDCYQLDQVHIFCLDHGIILICIQVLASDWHTRPKEWFLPSGCFSDGVRLINIWFCCCVSSLIKIYMIYDLSCPQLISTWSALIYMSWYVLNAFPSDLHWLMWTYLCWCIWICALNICSMLSTSFPPDQHWYMYALICAGCPSWFALIHTDMCAGCMFHAFRLISIDKCT